MDANDDPPSQSLGGTYAVSTTQHMGKHSAGQIRSVMNREHPIFIPGTWTYASAIAESPFADGDKSELLASRVYGLN
jgi:hypothetical protein